MAMCGPIVLLICPSYRCGHFSIHHSCIHYSIHGHPSSCCTSVHALLPSLVGSIRLGMYPVSFRSALLRSSSPTALVMLLTLLSRQLCICRSLQAGEATSSTSEQAADFLAFGSAALAPAVQAACQEPAGDHNEPSLVFSGEKLIPLASWKGARLGPQLR